jgi:alginate O-acetyltransferase complex protein AlgI
VCRAIVTSQARCGTTGQLLSAKAATMLFNTSTFAIFFVLTYALYVVTRHRQQNVLLLVASYVFYGWWDWRFLPLLVASTLLDYSCALGMQRTDRPARRRLFLVLSLCGNLGMLGFFKYFGWFSHSFQELATRLGWQVDAFTLHVVLPVGISFYTFQTMSYVIDVYRREVPATRNLLDFAVAVAFFPHLVAGPIQRASSLLPQVQQRRRVTEAQFYQGIWLVFLGLFKKVFIADNLAPIVNHTFAPHSAPSGVQVLIAVYAFAFQIYGDFSGYSDIARGISRLMGFELMLNFRMPYFARNPREFWHRWHISLSTWLRDYLYVSLGGSRRGTVRMYVNLMLTMLLGGLWHGAAWTFVLWGFYQGALLVLYRLFSPAITVARQAFGQAERAWTVLSIGVTFQFVCLGWLIFRADSVAQIVGALRSVVFAFGDPGIVRGDVARLAFYVLPLLGIEIYKEATGDMHAIDRLDWRARGLVYFLMAVLLASAGASGGQQFIYFQF